MTNLEQRVRRLEAQNRTLRRSLACCVVLVVVSVSIGATQVARDLLVGGVLSVGEADNPGITLRPDGNAKFTGTLTMPAIELTSPGGNRRFDLDDFAALPQVSLQSADGGDPAIDRVTTRATTFDDIPRLAIECQGDPTPALVYFRSGEMEVPVGQLITFSLGYDRRLEGRQEFVELHRHVLNDIDGSSGADFVWLGTIPAQAERIKMRWRGATGQPATIGVENGQRRSLVLLRFTAGGN